MTLGLFVPRSFVSPNGSCGYIPRRRPYSSMVGSGLSRVHRTAVFSGQPLTACPGYAFSPTSGGGISSRAAPFPKNGTGRGVWVELLHYKTEVLKYNRFSRMALKIQRMFSSNGKSAFDGNSFFHKICRDIRFRQNLYAGRSRQYFCSENSGKSRGVSDGSCIGNSF